MSGSHKAGAKFQPRLALVDFQVILKSKYVHAHDTEAGPPSPPRLFGPYSLDKRIAIGGCAEVFLGRIRGNAVAPPLIIKRLLPGVRGPTQVNILTREAALHKRIEHPNVVRVLDAGEVQGEPYIAMEFVDGLDLYRLLQRSSSTRQAIPPELAVFIARSVAKALWAVHEIASDERSPIRIIHGDVSPSNVYLSMTGEVKLGDFGIARVATEVDAGDETHRRAGHFGYLAPERLTGEPYDHRVDIFALGVILGELLIGKRVFPGEGQLAVMLSIRDGNIAPLRHAAKTLPTGLFEVCEKALSKNPADRFGTAEDFARALAPFEKPGRAQLAASLSSWVTWAKDNARFVQDLEQRVRESVGVMRAVSRSSSGIQALNDDGTTTNACDPESGKSPREDLSRVRRAGSEDIISVDFPKLIEMVATGDLQMVDEVALWGAPFQPVGKIEELARHLLPSTTAKTSRQFAPGPPDFIADFEEASMLSLLGDLHNTKATASLFVVQSLRDRETRKDIYIREGRLLHVASSDPHELFGEYLVSQGILRRSELELALSQLGRSGMHLGEILISMKLVDPVDVFTALRNQGRDRVADLCGWKRGHAQVYRGAAPDRMLFPLDLDLTVAMMTGAIRSNLAPPNEANLVPGTRAPNPKEKTTSIPLLNLVPMVARRRTSMRTALTELCTLGTRHSHDEAAAAVVTAHALQWVAYEPF